MTREEEQAALKEMYDYQEAYNTGYNLAQTLDDPNISEQDKKALKNATAALEKSDGQSDKLQAMQDGLRQYQKEKEREQMRALLRSGEDKSKDKDRER